MKFILAYIAAIVLCLVFVSAALHRSLIKYNINFDLLKMRRGDSISKLEIMAKEMKQSDDRIQVKLSEKSIEDGRVRKTISIQCVGFHNGLVGLGNVYDGSDAMDKVAFIGYQYGEYQNIKTIIGEWWDGIVHCVGDI